MSGAPSRPQHLWSAIVWVMKSAQFELLMMLGVVVPVSTLTPCVVVTTEPRAAVITEG